MSDICLIFGDFDGKWMRCTSSNEIRSWMDIPSLSIVGFIREIVVGRKEIVNFRHDHGY